MPNTDIGRLKEIAFSVRQILERYSLSTNDIMFQLFPRGCCGPASELLGRCLIELGFANVSYIPAERRDDTRSHAWINVDDVIVDITADQFGEPSVIVVASVRGPRNGARNRRNQSVRQISGRRIRTLLGNSLLMKCLACAH
jgi:hypothetical protein